MISTWPTAVSNSVSVFVDPAPAVPKPSTLTGLNGPTGLAFDASGNLYVANFGHQLDPGTTVSVFSPGSATPTGDDHRTEQPRRHSHSTRAEIFM